jgi:hypothetical protein
MSIKEQLKFQFRAEMFNISNHPNFGNPNTTWNTGSFGNITQTKIVGRDIQFGAKLVFWCFQAISNCIAERKDNCLCIVVRF